MKGGVQHARRNCKITIILMKWFNRRHYLGETIKIILRSQIVQSKSLRNVIFYPLVASIKGIHIFDNLLRTFILWLAFDLHLRLYRLFETNNSRFLVHERDILHIPPRSTLRSAYKAYLADGALKKLCHDIWKRDLIQSTNPGFEIQSCNMCTEFQTHST
jgi:hypothetical protein